MKMRTSSTLARIFCVGLVLILVQAEARNIPAAGQKQKAAEELGDHILQSLHKSLDFSSVFPEYFVSDPAMRRQEVELVFGRRLNPDYRAQIDQAAVERAYVALWNHWYVLWVYFNTHPTDADTPSEFDAEYKSAFSADLDQIKTGQELDKVFTDRVNHFLDQIRKRIPPGAFESAIYKQNLARFKEDTETADIPQMRADFGLGKGTEIYVVKREFFNYFLIEEGGTLKVFTVSLRSNKPF